MRRLRPQGDDGFAMISVIGIVSMLSAVVVASLAYAIGSQKASRNDQDFHASLAAAEAGIDDYLYRINRDGQYWTFGNPARGQTADPTNGAFTGWVAVPGSTSPAKFRYDVDSSRFPVDGTLRITSTGKVGGKTRTVSSTLRRRNFLDFLYFTDLETKDPALYDTAAGDTFTPTQAQANCSRYYYASPPRHDDCVSINFTSRDIVDGPLHTNDAMLVCGSPRFRGDTSTTWNDPARRRYRVNSSCGTASPTFSRSGDPRLVDVLTLPPSNTAIKAEVDPTLTDTPGCLYVGPTQIVFNSNGTMNVTSPWTKVHNPGCGVGNNRPLPPNGVIYIDNVPADNSTDPNSWKPSRETLPTCRTNGNAIGYPITNDITRYGCRTGDAFIEGTLKGRLTLATANNIILTWHMQMASMTNDILGLVANNYVEVYHPVRCTSSTCTNLNIPSKNAIFQNAEIDAAILAVAHSFRVQNEQYGACPGELRVTGAIAQKYRGVVGRFSGSSCSSGYDKRYVYDARLKYQSPPFFLDPVKSSFGISSWAESRAVYE
jgi:type II secretory pathway pseudopilin PulG